MGNRVTAREAGVTKHAVALQRKRGVPAEQIIVASRARKAARDAKKAPEITDAEYVQAVRLKAIEDAKKVERENRVREGELTEVAVVAREWSGILTSVRDSMMGLPLKLSGRLASLTDQRAIERYLKDSIRAELTKCSDAFSSGSTAA